MYDNKIYTYIPSKVLVAVDNYRVGGIVSINVSKDSPRFNMVKGIRGQNTRVRQWDESYRIVLELLQTDPANDFFQYIYDLDGGREQSGYFPIRIQDLNGTSLFIADTAYIEGHPDIDFNTEFTNRKWVLRTMNNSKVFLGGNDRTAGI